MSKRPQIKVPIENLDYVIELVSITILIFCWIYTVISYPDLPEKIASHYNASGQPDGYSAKPIVFLLPTIATIMYVGLLVLTRYPHLHNYTVNITEMNALKNCRFSIRILRIVNFLCVLLLTFIAYKMIQGGMSKNLNIGSSFLPIVIGISIVLPICILMYQRKLNKS